MENKKYPIIDVKANGNPHWSGGAFVMVFVYSKFAGNFILRGYHEEVQKYLKENYTHYFCYWSFWHNGKSRGYWRFWKERVYFDVPSKLRKNWKYGIIKYAYVGDENFSTKVLDMPFKRLPKRWIPLFDQF